MMISSEPSSRAQREKLLQQFLDAEPGIDTELVAFSAAGDRLVLHGCVGSYALKVRAAKLARDAGFTDVENCLRVVPGTSQCSHSAEVLPTPSISKHI